MARIRFGAKFNIKYKYLVVQPIQKAAPESDIAKLVPKTPRSWLCYILDLMGTVMLYLSDSETNYSQKYVHLPYCNQQPIVTKQVFQCSPLTFVLRFYLLYSYPSNNNGYNF